jgi:predicted nucleic acid-binding protein
VTVVIDSCTLINLFNTGLATRLIDGLPYRLLVPAAVVSEIVEQRSILDSFLSSARVQMADDSLIGIAEFSELKLRFDLGDGETEAIAIARQLGSSAACDDKKAREAFVEIIGASRLMGSIGIIAKGVKLNIVTEAEGLQGILRAKTLGAYFPAKVCDIFREML